MHSKEPDRKCPECACDKLVSDYETGEVICGKCGFVISSKTINFGPEWRAFTSQQWEKLPRTGAPTNLMIHDKGLSTIIDWKNVDGTGKRMNSSQKYLFYRLRKWNRRTQISESNQRNLAYALSNISAIGDELNLPKNVIETASSIYRKVMEKGNSRGRKIKCLAASAIYAACRQCNVIRTLDDVAKSTEHSKKEISRAYRFMHENINANIPLFSFRKYIQKYVSQLALCGETEKIALKLLSKVSNQNLTVGRSPRGITASCVYIACQVIGEKQTQTDIARIAQVSEVTIRNRYKEIMGKIQLLIKI